VAKVVLLIEDDPDTRDILTIGLRAQRCDVMEAENRDAALALIKARGVPDVIIMDYMMHGMSAEEFIQELTAITSALPRVILMTAANQADDRAKALGIPEVLRKPFSPLDVFAQIEPCVA